MDTQHIHLWYHNLIDALWCYSDSCNNNKAYLHGYSFITSMNSKEYDTEIIRNVNIRIFMKKRNKIVDICVSAFQPHLISLRATVKSLLVFYLAEFLLGMIGI